jgi:maleylacetoacetate isomerase
MSGDGIKLYTYWRSSAAYRARIALNLKGLAYESIPVHLIRDGGEQHQLAYQEINPQELVPVLIDGERIVRQSLAIIEYLDEMYPGARLLPVTARERARVRGLALAIACDIHPLNNLRVLQHLEHELNMPQIERDAWVQHWIRLGLTSFEAMLSNNPSTGSCCEGDTPSMADICLIPQVYNARRFQVEIDAFPNIRRIDEHLSGHPAFDAARPELQPDAPLAIQPTGVLLH